MNSRFALSVVLVFLGFALAHAQSDDTQNRVYQLVATTVDSPFETVVDSIDSYLRQTDYEVLSHRNVGVPENCSFRSTVLVVYNPEAARAVFALNEQTAPFGVIGRINVFEDERGVNVSIVNPHSVLRTVLLDDPGATNVANRFASDLHEIVTSALEVQPSLNEYGQKRKKGYIGRTMGVMAGGPFDEKIRVEHSFANIELERLIPNLEVAFTEPAGKWGLELAFVREMPENGLVLVGVTGKGMEAKSFDIVENGSDKSRKDFECAGIAHAGAYPFELVLRQNGSNVDVYLVHMMYRMKLYFEDAGKWAFMKNMGMPDSLVDELRAQLDKAAGLAS